MASIQKTTFTIQTYLNTGVGAQVEVELGGVADADVHRRPRRDVARLAAPVLAVPAEEAGVVALLHHYERDARLVAHLQHRARRPDGAKLAREYL